MNKTIKRLALVLVLVAVLLAAAWPVDIWLDRVCTWARGPDRADVWGWSIMYWHYYRYVDRSYEYNGAIVVIFPEAVDYYADYAPGEGVGFSDEIGGPPLTGPAGCTYRGHYKTMLLDIGFEPGQLIEPVDWFRGPRYSTNWSLKPGRLFN